MNRWQIAQIICMTILAMGSPIFNFLRGKYHDANNSKHHVIVNRALWIWVLVAAATGFTSYKLYTLKPEKAKLAVYFDYLPIGKTNLFTVPATNKNSATLTFQVRNLNTNVPAEGLVFKVLLPTNGHVLNAVGWNQGRLSKYDPALLPSPIYDSLFTIPWERPYLFYNEVWEVRPLIVEYTNLATATHMFAVMAMAKNADMIDTNILVRFNSRCTNAEIGFGN